MALPELVANSPVPGTPAALGTITADITTTGATTITTSGAAPGALQAAGQFRICIDNELMIVTGGASTNTWTVTRQAEGSNPATHSSGASIYHFLTAAALANLTTNIAVASSGVPSKVYTQDYNGLYSWSPASLPWLGVYANQICVAQTKQPVILRGTNIMEAEWRGNTIWESVVIPNLAQNWGGNLIVHGFASDPVNLGTAAYLALLDSYVQLCARNGCYLVLAWRSYAQNGGLATLPDTSAFGGAGSSTGAMVALQALATRYNGLAHVMFECQVEPQTATWSDVQGPYQTIVDAIRTGASPYSPIVFCCGVGSGKDISGAVSSPVVRSNICYDSHPYTGAANFQGYFGVAYDAGLPVAVLEFGPTAFLSQADIDASLIPYMRQRGLSWAGWTSDYDGTPNLVDRTLTPTSPFGLNTQAAMFAAPPSTDYSQNKVDSLGPKAHYELEETSGTVATDISGNGFNGTIQGTPTFNVVGGSYDDFGMTFASASTQRVDIGNIGLPTAATAVGWSVVFWYKCSGVGTNEYFFSASKSSGVNPFWGINHNNTAISVFARDDAGTQLFSHTTSGVTINSGTWHHVVWTVNRSGNSTVYVDGVQRGQAACGAGSTVTADLYAIGATRISNAPGNYLNGSVSLMAAYPAELTQAQVTALYSAAIGLVYGPDEPLNSAQDVLPAEQGIALVMGAWQNLTLPTHVTVNGAYAARAALLGNAVLVISAYLTFDVTGIAANTPFATLPSTSMYPTTAKPIQGGKDTGTAYEPCYLDTSGNLNCVNALASTNVMITCTVPIGF